MKLPNGYGSITKLKGNRRNPFLVRVTVGSSVDPDTGRLRLDRRVLGYFPNQAAARQALADYHSNPDSLRPTVTFAEVFEEWSEEKFEGISRSGVSGYMAAFNALSDLHGRRFRELQPLEIQRAINASGKAYPSRKKMKSLISQLYKFAALNRIVPSDINPAASIDIGRPESSGKIHARFSRDELEVLWRWSSGNPYVQLILIMVYSGARPGEVLGLRKDDVNLAERFFYIREAKNATSIRRVPIHRAVLPFWESWMSMPGEMAFSQMNGEPFRFQTNHGQFTETYWDPVLRDLNILTYIGEDGAERSHKPHDCRHSFTSLWKEEKLDEAMRRRIQGHAGLGIGEQVYTEYEMAALLAELDRLWVPGVTN